MILIGFAEALSAPEVVWSLVDAGFRVAAFARKGHPSALRHSRHVTCYEICPPEVDLQKSASDLMTMLESLDTKASGAQQILFPVDDKALWLCSRMKLRSNWLLAGPSGPNAELALNKCLQVRAAQDAGFNVPKTHFAQTAEEVRTVAETLSFPIILKAAESVPTWQRGLYDCRKFICANTLELEHALDEWKERTPLLIQPFITGVGEGVFGLAAPDGVRAWSGHRRLRMMNPQGSGSSACVSQAVAEDVKAQTQAFMKAVQWRGIFMIELLRDDAGVLWFVELNGRPWGSIALSRRQGYEYPAWQVSVALDEQSPAGLGMSSALGVVCRNVGREFMHLLFVLKGPKSTALAGWPPVWKTLADVAWIRRGDTFYNWRREDARVFFADCCYTVKSNVFKAKH